MPRPLQPVIAAYSMYTRGAARSCSVDEVTRLRELYEKSSTLAAAEQAKNASLNTAL